MLRSWHNLWKQKGMARRRVAVLAGAFHLLSGVPAIAQNSPQFRSEAALVRVGVTVRDARGRLVRGLGLTDFVVRDRGVERPVRQVLSDEAPLSVAVLFDVSGSMEVASRMQAARLAATALLGALEPGRDEAALLAFDSRLHDVAPFTADVRSLNGVLGQMDPFGATSLHDAIAAAAARVGQRTHPRRAVIVLTDGVDTSSRYTPAEVSGQASSIDVPVYVIALVLPIDDPSSDRATPQAGRAAPGGSVSDLARWTGGQLRYASDPLAARRVARDMVDELRHQYVLGIDGLDGPGWHPLEIRTTTTTHTVRARGGYMLEARP
jgi:Ca-activated chloride channel family protein